MPDLTRLAPLNVTLTRLAPTKLSLTWLMLMILEPTNIVALMSLEMALAVTMLTREMLPKKQTPTMRLTTAAIEWTLTRQRRLALLLSDMLSYWIFVE